MRAAVIVAFALVVGFALWESRSRHGAEAESFERGAFDRGSTLLIAVVFSLGFVLLPTSLALSAWGIGATSITLVVAWIGIVIMLLGIALRVWANQTLGRFFTRTLRVTAEQRVVRDGPYRLVRHPGYLGDILLWIGAALATLNWLVVVILTVTAVLAYSYRIRVEEAMLQEALGDTYRAYMRHTWRLVPLVY